MAVNSIWIQALALLLMTAGTGASSTPLVPSPVLSETSLVQCGCDNSALLALRPDPSALGPGGDLTEITLTGFFFANSYNGEDTRCRSLQSSTAHLIPAALVALDEVNNSSDILAGYHLSLDLRDSQCDVVHSTAEFASTVAERILGIPPSNYSFNLGVIGSECGSVIDTLGGISSRSLRLPVVSYWINSFIAAPGQRGGGATASLFHLSRSLLFGMQSAIGFMRHLKWVRNVAFATDNSELFLPILERVVTTDPVSTSAMFLDGGNGNISIGENFTKFRLKLDGLAPSKSMESFFGSVRFNSIRVILGLVSQKLAAQLICTGRLGTIPGDGFVYVFVGLFSDNWWETENSVCNLTSADVQSVLVVSGSIINPNSSTVLESGRAVRDFKVEYTQRQREWCGSDYGSVIDPSAGLVYDSIWALALALSRSTDAIGRAVERGSHYDPEAMDAILQELESVRFEGVTGEVRFSEGERMGAESISQIQDGEMVVVGHFANNVYIPSLPFAWNGSLSNGSSNETPSAEVEEIIKSVDTHWWALSLVFTSAGIVFAVAMWIFNWWHGNHRILLASSQKLNYVIIVGVIFGYLTVLILTLLESPLGPLLSDEVFKILCLIRVWMLPLSFTLTYGILFARAWRIYRVFNNPWNRSRPYKDYHLMLIVLGVALIDVAALTPWSVIDPYRRFAIPAPVDYGQFSRCKFFGCASDRLVVWLLVVVCYKVFVIMGGIIVISLVRKQVVERKIFDDTKSMAAAVYITALAFLIGLPVNFLFLLSNQIIPAYIVSVVWVNISSSATLICVFLPKFYRIVMKKDTGESYRRARRLYYRENTFSKAQSQSIDLALSTCESEVRDARLSPECTRFSPEGTDL